MQCVGTNVVTGVQQDVDYTDNFEDVRAAELAANILAGTLLLNLFVLSASACFCTGVSPRCTPRASHAFAIYRGVQMVAAWFCRACEMSKSSSPSPIAK
jgi:hypothetical protein